MFHSESQYSVRQCWRPALLFILVVVSINVVISFIHNKLYPSHCFRASHVPLHIQQESIQLLGDPRQLYLGVDTPLLPLADKDLIVRSAYVNHPSPLRNGPLYVNYTAILLEVRKPLLDEKTLESCGVGGHISFKFEVYIKRTVNTYHTLPYIYILIGYTGRVKGKVKVLRNLLDSYFIYTIGIFLLCVFLQVVQIGGGSCNEGGRYTHTQALLYCYDVYAKHLEHAWVTYKKTIFNEVLSVRAMAERPILLHTSGYSKRGVAVCAAMLPHYTPFMEDWIRYQRTIGVDHIHLVLESLFLNQGRFDEEFLQRSVEQGYLSVEFWHQWLNSTDICDQSLDLALYNCAFQFKESYSYVVFSDPRDFFVPRDASLRPRLSDFLSDLCPDTHCQFEWKNIIYRHCERAGIDGNITAVVTVAGVSRKDKLFTVYKSGLMQYGTGLLAVDESKGVKVPVEKGYFAHLGKYANSSNFRILPEHERCH